MCIRDSIYTVHKAQNMHPLRIIEPSLHLSVQLPVRSAYDRYLGAFRHIVPQAPGQLCYRSASHAAAHNEQMLMILRQAQLPL